MPWATPTLRKVREMVRDEITSAVSGAVLIGNNSLRVMADVMAGLAHLTLRYVDWLALQLMADTAEAEWLDRHGDIWLTNADGSVGRKSATYAEGQAGFTGVVGSVIPAFAVLTAGNLTFETTEQLVLGEGTTVGPVRALVPGAISNLLDGTSISLQGTATGVDGSATVTGDMVGGTDEEQTEDLRLRTLLRIRQPPMGGDQDDYVNWALRVPGVTRAWSFPLEMGMGTVTVRFMMDDLRAAQGGFPSPFDVRTVKDYMDTVRPVAVKDFFVEAPIPYRIDFRLSNVQPDTSAVRAAIHDSVVNMLEERAAPGATIYAAWKHNAVYNAAGVVSFTLDTTDDVMPDPGKMPVLGDIYYV